MAFVSFPTPLQGTDCQYKVIPVELASRGYKQQHCVDFSSAAVELMKEKHAEHQGIKWSLMDVRDMKEIQDRSVDVAFDKGTLDAMIHGSPWSPPQKVKDDTGAYLREVHRVLKDNGRFLYVTFRQPHFMKILLNPEGLWGLEMQILGDSGSFDYLLWVPDSQGGSRGARASTIIRYRKRDWKHKIITRIGLINKTPPTINDSGNTLMCCPKNGQFGI